MQRQYFDGIVRIPIRQRRHSWQLSYKHLDQLGFSLMALGLHYYVKQGFKQKIFDPTIDYGLKLAFIDATYCHFIR